MFFPLVSSREHSVFSIRGAVGGLPSRMPQTFLPTTNTARAEGRGIKGGRGPLRRRSRNQEVPGVSFAAFMLLLSSTRESRPGCGAERPLMGAVGGFAPHIGERRGGVSPLAKPSVPCAGHRAAKSPPGSWRRGSPLPAPSAPLAQTAPAARPETRRGPDAAGSRAGRLPDRDG